MKKPVTLVDIAKACNTSNVTVSKALTDKGGVSDELRAKIKKTAEEMGYVPSKAVSSKKINNVGVVIPVRYAGAGSYYTSLYESLVQRLRKENLYCIAEELSEKDEQNLVMPKFLRDDRVAAVISLGQLSDTYAGELAANCEEMVMCDYYVPGIRVNSIVTNGYNGGYKLTSYLLSLGHRKIGFIGTKLATTSIFDRYMGYLKATIEHGLELRDDWVIDDRDEKGPIPLKFPEEMPTAFVCNCDETALIAIRELGRMGLRVPDDISIVGYDNYLSTEVAEPPITTISIDVEFMAELTVYTLVQRMNDPTALCRMRSIEGDLVIKRSVRPLL